MGLAISGLHERRCNLSSLGAAALEHDHLSSTDLVADVVHTARDENSVRSRHAVNLMRLTFEQRRRAGCGGRPVAILGLSSLDERPDDLDSPAGDASRSFEREDEKRIEYLLFVGITRAMNWVYMSSTDPYSLAPLETLGEAEDCGSLEIQEAGSQTRDSGRPAAGGGEDPGSLLDLL